MTIIRLFALIVLPLLILTSCGSDDDDDGGGTQVTQEQQDCLTPGQQENIRTLLDDISDITLITGEATVEENGDSTGFEGGYDFSSDGNDAWDVRGAFCNFTECFDVERDVELRNGCLIIDNVTATVNEITENSVTLTTVENQDGGTETINTVLTLEPDDDVNIRETTTEADGDRSVFTFEQN